MIPFLLATSLSCEDATDLIKRIKKHADGQAEIEMIEVIKSETEPGCWDAND
jgi:hypothetical protein